MAYRNATFVLPPKLLKRVQKYYSGLLWVPPVSTKRRDKEILMLSRKGLRTSQIAEVVHLSIRRVQQVLREATERRKKN